MSTCLLFTELYLTNNIIIICFRVLKTSQPTITLWDDKSKTRVTKLCCVPCPGCYQCWGNVSPGAQKVKEHSKTYQEL